MLCAQVLCVDAPVRLQEAWVRDELAAFELRETDLARRMGAELDAARRAVAPGAAEWDEALGRAVRAGSGWMCAAPRGLGPCIAARYPTTSPPLAPPHRPTARHRRTAPMPGALPPFP